ncbi:MAG: Bug family tripartite tricarboxylate transporter substrate binding protein, partial [Rhodospirillales bacterium]
MGHRPLAALIVSVAAAFAVPAQGQTPAEFFAGKTITLVVGYTAGGSYDFYARFLAEFLPRHLPGKPTIIVQNRPGAGSRNAANHVYAAAAKDGTVIGLTNNMLPLFQYLQPTGVRYDMTQVNWMGNMVVLNSVVALWHTAPAKTLDEARQAETVLGSTGRGGETYIVPAMMNAVLGTKFKIVTGYPGINEITLAIERGELHGRSGSWANIVQQSPEWVSGKKINVLAQIGAAKDPELPTVPLIT